MGVSGLGGPPTLAACWLFPSPKTRGGRGGGGGGGRGGTPAAFPWRARRPTPRKLMDHRRFCTGHRGFFGKNPNHFLPPTPLSPPLPPPPPPPTFPPHTSRIVIRHQRGPPTPATQTRVLGLAFVQQIAPFGSWCYPLPPPPPTFHRGASVSQLFGILPSRLRCSSNHAMRKASFEPTSGFRPFNYALVGSAA